MKLLVAILSFAAFNFGSGIELYSQVVINEFVASNSSGAYHDPLNDSYPDWIELYNMGDSDFDLSSYHLSDDIQDPDKWKIPSGTIIPANGFLLFIADDADIDTHTNFKLSADGEAIVLSDEKKNLVDSYVYMAQSTNISMGRTVQNSAVWVYYSRPTPGLANSSPGYSGKSMAPVFSWPGGFYTGPIVLHMESPENSAIIRYTLDGSLPTTNSMVFDGPISIQSNTIVRALAFVEGLMNSDLITHSYFIEEQVSLPVFSFSMPQGIVKYFPPPAEQAYHMEYFDQNKSQVINQDIGVRITGLAGVHPMRSFSLYARSEYGDSRMDHQFFGDKNQTEFKNLMIRNGGYQDYSYTYLRDGVIQSLIKGYLDLEYQAYQPVVIFTNGNFLALMNMREKQNEFFIEYNTGVDKDSIDLLEYQTNPPIETLSGDSLHFVAMMDFIEKSDMTVQSNMDYLETQMDVKNYLDYYMLQVYCSNMDWPDKNSKIWRPRRQNGKWRWVVFDVDYGYGFTFSAEESIYEYLYNLEGPFYHNRPWVTVIFRKIMENEGVRNYYLQRFNGLLNTAFHPNRAVQMVDSLKAQIEPEMGRHIEKWGAEDYGIPSMELWQSYCDTLYDFAKQRPRFARRNMMEFYGVEDTVNISMRSSNGSLYVNDLRYCHDSATGVFFSGIPLELRAVPDPGYEFVEWVEGPDMAGSSGLFTPNSDTNIEAVFRPLYKHILDRRIVSDTVFSDTLEPYIASGDLIIPANVDVSLEKGVQLLMPEGCNIYVYGSLSIRGTESSPVVIGSYDGIWGGLCFDHSTALSELNHLVLKNASTAGVPDRFSGAISAYQSRLNLQSVVIENVPGNPVFAQYSDIRVEDCRFHSIGTCDLINVKYADTAIVENSVFMDSRMPDTDAIDFDAVKYGVIRNNRIHNLVGENSDGIDIGEESTNVEISGNLITNCSDKGISIGQASTMTVSRNIIYQCSKGIAIKDFGTAATISNNTLVGNSIGIACYEKNPGKGSGTAFTMNTIIADSEIYSILERNQGVVSVGYSLSNTEVLPGLGNQFGNPGLSAPQALNFELLPTSPCIDGGSPDSPLDADGSIADMGAYFISDWKEIHQDLIINEYYSNTTSEDPEDWIEIYNKGDSAIDLSKWYVLDGDNRFFSLQNNTQIEAQGYLVICKDTSNFKSFYGSEHLLAGNFDFSLGRSRDLIALFDDSYSPVKSLVYDEDERWPDSKDKDLLSVALIDTSLSITEARSWRTGYQIYGTPGYSNIPPRVTGLYLNEISGAAQSVFHDEYDEYEDWIEIYNANDQEISLGDIYLTDDLSQPAMSRVRQNVPDSTLIAAKGFHILFADGDPEQGVNHLNFKIGAGGEEIGLVQMLGLDTVIIDQIIFGELLAGFSLGRRIDGGTPWERQDYTPGVSNNTVFTPASDLFTAMVYPNPVSEVLHISLNANQGLNTDIRIINTLGQGVFYEPGIEPGPGSVITMNISSLQPGVYYVQIRSGEEQCVKRIVVSR